MREAKQKDPKIIILWIWIFVFACWDLTLASFHIYPDYLNFPNFVTVFMAYFGFVIGIVAIYFLFIPLFKKD